jgi:hypothetical protein
MMDDDTFLGWIKKEWKNLGVFGVFAVMILWGGQNFFNANASLIDRIERAQTDTHIFDTQMRIEIVANQKAIMKNQESIMELLKLKK